MAVESDQTHMAKAHDHQSRHQILKDENLYQVYSKNQNIEDDTCEVFIFDPLKVKRRQRDLDKTADLADLFKVMADETRLKILFALSQEDELCVCDVATIIGSTNATASHHLRLLKNMSLAQARKEGKMVFYSLKSPYVRHLLQEAVRLKEEERQGAGRLD